MFEQKPKPGMLLQAAEDFNIDLSLSWMVGDSKDDIEAGINAGCKTALLTGQNSINKKDHSYHQTVMSEDLRDFTEKYLK